MSESSCNMKLKLFLDKKSSKVLFAEASKDFVDFLFSLMSLPLGQVVNLLTKDQMVGSISNLFGSIKSLDETYVQSSGNIEYILNPKSSQNFEFILNPTSPVPSFQNPLLLSSIESLSVNDVQCSKNVESVLNLKLAPVVSFQNLPLLPKDEIVRKKKGLKGKRVKGKSKSTYTKSSVTSYRCVSDDDSDITFYPRTASTKQVDSGSNTSKGYKLQYVDSGSGSGGAKQVASGSSGGFVKGVVTYMVTDDLEVKPMSTISSITLINSLNIRDLSSLEEKVVDIGVEEGLEILQLSMQSKHVFTGVFLRNQQKI
ncbi:hypothetical protein M5689_001814 [Euphorbia peplus]|nr:hypothetical protein M5689_001814 [Euphorbia peplus]